MGEWGKKTKKEKILNMIEPKENILVNIQFNSFENAKGKKGTLNIRWF